jgi:TAG lipase/lysophosphatidylethanolamine acyltransferase
LQENLRDAHLFEEWEAAAFQLDELLGYDLWSAPLLESTHY